VYIAKCNSAGLEVLHIEDNDPFITNNNKHMYVSPTPSKLNTHL